MIIDQGSLTHIITPLTWHWHYKISINLLSNFMLGIKADMPYIYLPYPLVLWLPRYSMIRAACCTIYGIWPYTDRCNTVYKWPQPIPYA